MLIVTITLIHLHPRMAFIVPIALDKSTSGPEVSPNPGLSTKYISYWLFNRYFGNIAKGYRVIDLHYGLVCNNFKF